MEKQRTQEKEDWILYLDDNGRSTTAYVRDVKTENGFISFNTGFNTITIPASRLIKLKQKIQVEASKPSEAESPNSRTRSYRGENGNGNV